MKNFSPLRSTNEADHTSNQNLTIGKNIPIRISRRLAEQLANSKDGVTMSESEDVRVGLEKTANVNEFRSVSSMYSTPEQDSTSSLTVAGNGSSLERVQNVEIITSLKAESFSEQEVVISQFTL